VQTTASNRSAVFRTSFRFARICLGSARWLLAVCFAAAPALGLAQEDASGAQIADLRRDAMALEHGDGVPRDGDQAAALYCRAARLGDAASAFDLGWMYANARGVARDDALAASFFRIAAARGIEQANNMLRLLGEPSDALPSCLADPVAADPPEAAALTTEATAVALAPVSAPKQIVDLVKKLAPEYRVPAPLVLAIMQAESNFDATAVSPKNAQGLMQLVPDTAVRFRVRNVFDPAQNIRGGIAYLRWLLAYFEGEISLVAAAYNAGERSVERYLGVPPYEETQAYVRRILARVGTSVEPYDATVADPSPLLQQIRKRQEKK
jgi:soluble lytic murein transglycosylase-like protein